MGSLSHDLDYRYEKLLRVGFGIFLKHLFSFIFWYFFCFAIF